MKKWRREAFRGGRRWNAVPIVEKLPELTGTAFPLLKCLQTHYGRHCKSFSGQNTLDCSSFRTTGPPQKRPNASTQITISAWLASVPIVPV